MFLICITIIVICLIITPKIEQKGYQNKKLEESKAFWSKYNADRIKTKTEFKEKWGVELYR